MQDNEFPSLLARAFIGAAPKPALDLGAALCLRRCGAIIPDLFRVLAESAATVIRVELTDLPRRFLLQFGDGAPSLKLAETRTTSRRTRA